MKKLIILLLFIPLVSCESNLKYEYYDSGELLAQGKMVDDLKEGEWISYYKSGQKQAIIKPDHKGMTPYITKGHKVSQTQA